MFYPGVSPHDSQFALVGCDMTGSYVTRDGGLSWRMINLQQIAKQFAFDPVNPAVVYARAGGLYKSTDRGETWQLIYPTLTEMQGFASIGDHADLTIITTDRTKRRVTAFAIDPQNSTRLYAVIQIDDATSLFISKDAGQHWLASDPIKEGVLDLFIDPFSPPDERTLLVTHEHGILVREAGHWHNRPAPAGIQKINSFAAGSDVAGKQLVIYAISGKSYFNSTATPAGIYVTKNGGTNWTDLQPTLLAAYPKAAQPEWRAIATCWNAPGTIYVSYNGLSGSDGKKYFGVAQSEDYGLTWYLGWKDISRADHASPEKSSVDGWLDERFGSDWSENPFSIGVDPQNPQIAFATDFGRAVKTTDGGHTWRQTYTQKIDDHQWASRGLDVTNINSIVFDPFDRSRAYLTATDIGLMHSIDGGRSWASATNAPGIPEAWHNSTYWLIFDPQVKGRMWASMSSVHDLPREKMWRHRSPSSFDGGILLTEDGGKTWNAGSLEVGEAAVTHLLVDQQSPANNRTLYACAFGRGVLKSVDGGQHWTLKNHGISNPDPLAWRIYQRANDRALFLVVIRRSDSLNSDPVNEGAIYRSDDGAETWKQISLPHGTNAPTSLSVDSDSTGTLLLSTWGKKTGDPFTSDTGGGIYISNDEGRTWGARLTTDSHIYELTYDPRNRTYYACGFNAAAYYSADNGAHWVRIPGYDFKWGKRVDPDPLDPAMIYISTYGGGVWHGPGQSKQMAPAPVVPALPNQ